MNYAIVKFIIGKVLYFEAAFMMLPCLLYSPLVRAHWRCAYQKKSKKLCFLCKRGICNRCPELDCHEPYGRNSFSHRRRYDKPGGRSF